MSTKSGDVQDGTEYTEQWILALDVSRPCSNGNQCQAGGQMPRSNGVPESAAERISGAGTVLGDCLPWDHSGCHESNSSGVQDRCPDQNDS